ncbi:hypothetical protein [Kordia sp.]|uniref:hypothetical protein n=1 Tax=Kordia sp. TaxID=1965332 RepID=UPI003D2725AD
MKYAAIILLLLSIMMYGIFSDFPMIANIVLVACVTVVLLLWELSVLKNNFSADFTMKSHSKIFNKSNLLMAIIWSFILIPDIYKEGFNTFAFISLVMWLMIILIDVLMIFVYKKKKPITIFIDGNTLTFNNPWLQKRDLNNLNYIGIKKPWKELELGFKKKSDIRIPFKEYKIEEFRRFLDILVEKSEHDVYLTDNVLEKFRSPTLETPN